MAKLNTYRVTFEQPVLSTIDVQASNEDTAEECATKLYENTPGLLRLSPPKGWAHDFDPHRLISIEEIGGRS